MTNKPTFPSPDIDFMNISEGHNSGVASVPNHVANAASARLKSIVERVERLTDEKQAITDDIKEVFGEAKSDGHDIKALRKVIAERKKDPADKAEQDAIFETYWAAIK